jgi:hypothetical protein
MAHCPKCGKHLKIYNVSQFCPKCGVNLRFYEFEKNFYREAKYAELSNAAVHVKIRRLKASFIGNKLTILRLIAAVFPLAALLVPAAVFNLYLPFFSEKLALSGLGLYGAFSSGSLMYLTDMHFSSPGGETYDLFFKALLFYAVAAVLAVLILLLTLLCFLSVKNMQKIIASVAFAGAVFSLVSFFVLNTFIDKWDKCTLASAEVLQADRGYGFPVLFAAFAAVFAVNLLLWIKGIPVEYAQGMEERLEIYRKVKKGELDLDSLPQPVVETEETRKIDEEIAAEEENLARLKAEHRARNESAPENGTQGGETDE